MSAPFATALSIIKGGRTLTSDCYIIRDEKRTIAKITVAYSKFADVDLLFFGKITKKQQEFLIGMTYDLISDIDLDDIIISIYAAKEMNFLSNTVDWSEAPPTRAHIENLEKQLRSHTGKHQRILGQLNEVVVREYLELLNYNVSAANSKEDALKIDLVGFKDNTSILCQVKSGDINHSEIRKCLASMRSYATGPEKDFIFGFFARSFPADIEFVRAELERKFSCVILFVSSSEIAKALPQFRHALS